MIIAVDFDGTIVTHEYPQIGKPIPGALEALKELIQAGHQLILYTMRSGDKLEQAIAYLKNNDIDLWGINENPNQKDWTKSPKAYAHLYIDDAAYGCPLVIDQRKRPFVDWSKIKI